MVVCKFFLQGNCRFGDNCRNEHPRSSGGGFGNQNRFGALTNSGAGNDGRYPSSYTAPSPDDIRNDLTDGKGKPNWILTAYGPGKNPPASLLETNELSPEEIRVRFYEHASKGNQDAGDHEAIALWNQAAQSMNEVKNDADSVKKFMDEATQKEPNRYSLCKIDGSKPRDQAFGSQQPAPAFGAQTSSNPFSKPPTSTFGQPSGPSVFGKPAFGQTGFGSNNQQTPAFGQPGFGSGSTQSNAITFGRPAGTSGFGQGTFGKPSLGNTGFGRPSFGSTSFGESNKSSAFAAPSASSGFGRTSSAFGQPSHSATAFAEPSQPTSILGMPAQSTSAFGQQSQPTSTFGQPSQPTSAFGQPSQPSAFGQLSQPTPAFGQPSHPMSGFVQPPASSSTSQQPALSTAFGQPSQPGTSSFGQPAFGKPSAPAFGSAPAGTGIFGKPSAGPENPFGVKVSSPLSKEADMETSASRPVSRDNPFAQPPSAPSVFGIASPLPSPTTLAPAAGSTSFTPPAPGTPREVPAKIPLMYTQTLPAVPSKFDATGKLTSFRDQRVVYAKNPPTFFGGEEQRPTFFPCYQRPDGQGLEKIWFPSGNNDAKAVELEKRKKDFEAPEEEYTEEVLESYRVLHETGRWKGGVMPRVAPRREWVDCEF